MKEVFNEEVMHGFVTNSISYLKGGPSHTSKTQDLDCGRLFSSLKASIKTIQTDNKKLVNDTLKRSMSIAMRCTINYSMLCSRSKGMRVYQMNILFV